MPTFNTNLYNPQSKGRVVYPKEMVEAIRKNTVVLPNGKRISKSELERSMQASQGTLQEIPSNYVSNANRNDKILEAIGWQNKAGKPAITQGLAKTVGASALMAVGAGYSSPVVNTLGGLAKNVVAGAVGAEGFAMLDGRAATGTELAVSAGMEMGVPMALKVAEPVIKPIVQQISKVTDYFSAPKFKPNSDAYYRVIGNKEGFTDAIESNTLRPNQNGIFKDRNAYYTKGNVNDSSNPVIGGGVKKGTAYEGKYIAEVMPGTNYPQVAKDLNPEWNFGLTRNGEHIPTSSENVKLYKKDWLKGYREVSKPIPQTTPIQIKLKPVVETTPFQIEQPTTNTLQLKSTMLGSPLEKQLSKDGTLSINSLQAHLNNQSTSMADRTMIQKVLDEKFAGQSKINYNDLRKAVSDEMVPLEKNFDSNYSNYGVGSLGYPGVQKESIEKAIEFGKKNVSDAFKKRNMPGAYDMAKEAITSIRNNKKILSEIPQENTSIVYSNKKKFGRGSTDHFENEGTLGHSRILVSKEEPDVMHVLEQQSDFYQKHSPEEIGMSVELEKNIKRLDDLHQLRQTELKEILENKDGKFTSTDVLQQERLINSQYEALKMAKADLSNIEQKVLLGKTHQERLLQENVTHAAQNGQTKMRYPTPETAAKIQGYQQQINPELNSLYTKEDDLSRQINFNRANGYDIPQTDIDELESLRKIIDERKNEPMIYSKEHQTILKKYNDNPKMVKKVLGQDTRTVTDAKGNTWFEFDIPEAFRKGKAEIKALSTIGVVATGYKAIADKNKNKQ